MKTHPTPPKPRSAAKKERLEKALRANLARRKAAVSPKKKDA